MGAGRSDVGFEHQYEEALKLGRRDDLLQTILALTEDEGAWEEASRDPHSFLRDRGIEVPRGLRVGLVRRARVGKPVPDYQFFTIRLTNCQTIWVRGDDGLPREEEVCLGFEIVPHPLPGGPVA